MKKNRIEFLKHLYKLYGEDGIYTTFHFNKNVKNTDIEKIVNMYIEYHEKVYSFEVMLDEASRFIIRDILWFLYVKYPLEKLDYIKNTRFVGLLKEIKNVFDQEARIAKISRVLEIK